MPRSVGGFVHLALVALAPFAASDLCARPEGAPPAPALLRQPHLRATSEELRLAWWPVLRGEGERVVTLTETAGASAVARLTPVDPLDAPLGGGRVVILRPGERRTTALADALPEEQLDQADAVRVEVLSGPGEVAVATSWPANIVQQAEATAAPRTPRRELHAEKLPPSEALIDNAEQSGTITHETAVLYKVYAVFGDARLPSAYRGDDSVVPDSLIMATVVSEWSTYSPATQATLQPFLVPPAYQQGYKRAGLTASALDTPPICTLGNLDPHWDYVENTNGKVRVWFDVNSHDQAAAGVMLAQAENTILPKLTSLMTGHDLLSDDNVACNGGSGQLDIYLCDQPQSVTVGYGGCSYSPVFIRLRRDTSAALLAHEMFHAFQWSMPLAHGACITSPDYRWWAEASAQWVQDYVYQFDQAEQTAAPAFLSDPSKPLDLSNDPHWYGAYLLPFFVYRSTRDATFVRKSWENCSGSKAVQALNDALAAAGPGDFSKVWPDFALHNWNQAPVDQYTSWDSLRANVLPSVTTGNINTSALPFKEATLTLGLPHLTATYKHFVFSDNSISSVAFFNGVTYDLEQMSAPPLGSVWNPQAPANPDAVKGIKVQALYKINNSWTQDDWTNKPYVTFCRDLTAERLQELVIVISNARLDDSAGTFDAPGMAPVLWVSGIGCYQWKGTTSYTESSSSSTQNDTTTNLVWTRVDASQQPPTIDYAASGSVNVAMSGQCSGGGTFPISSSPLTSLTTYNYMPAGSPGAQSYRGQGYDNTFVNITCAGKPGGTFVGPWFTVPAPSPPTFPFYYVSNDGKHMTGTWSPTTGVTWQWDLHAQQQ